MEKSSHLSEIPSRSSVSTPFKSISRSISPRPEVIKSFGHRSYQPKTPPPTQKSRPNPRRPTTPMPSRNSPLLLAPRSGNPNLKEFAPEIRLIETSTGGGTHAEGQVNLIIGARADGTISGHKNCSGMSEYFS